MNPTDTQAQQALLTAAQSGDAHASWTVYTHFQHYAQALRLPVEKQYQFLQQALQAGHAEAQFEVAKLLRGGWLTLQGATLNITDQQPTQADLNTAHNLLEQAAAQGHERAANMLHNLPPSDWDARTARRSSFGTHAPMLRDPQEQAEEDELAAAENAKPNWPLRLLLLIAVAFLLWGAWSLYSARLAQKTAVSLEWPIPPTAAILTFPISALHNPSLR